MNSLKNEAMKKHKRLYEVTYEFTEEGAEKFNGTDYVSKEELIPTVEDLIHRMLPNDRIHLHIEKLK